ncbi:hypothetical protein E4U61_001997 [Claviceps capensis]|nr:hypothetical protein E4U61_001997 [Claviceps capensis]
MSASLTLSQSTFDIRKDYIDGFIAKVNASADQAKDTTTERKGGLSNYLPHGFDNMGGQLRLAAENNGEDRIPASVSPQALAFRYFFTLLQAQSRISPCSSSVDG